MKAFIIDRYDSSFAPATRSMDISEKVYELHLGMQDGGRIDC